MQYCKKISILIGLLLTLIVAYASTSSLLVKSAELITNEDFYLLNADYEIELDDLIEEAINKGVPLTFLTEFQIVKPYQYWFDDEVVTVSKQVSVTYHALTKQYLVNRDSHQKSFETLSEALHELRQLREWKVAKKNELEKGESYRAAILIRLDKSKLPKAIQVDAFGSEDWNLVSPIFSWSLKDIK